VEIKILTANHGLFLSSDALCAQSSAFDLAALRGKKFLNFPDLVIISIHKLSNLIEPLK
jgi:hypothetical protein